MHSQDKAANPLTNQDSNSQSTILIYRTVPFGSSMVGSLLSGLLVLVSFAAAGEFASPPTPIANQDQRSIRDYRLDVKAFMKLSKHDDEQVKRNAIYNLCVLHGELAADTRFDSNNQIQSFRVTVAKRLEGYSKDFEKRLAVAARREKKSKRGSSSGSSYSKLANVDDEAANENLANNEGSQITTDEDTAAKEEYEAMYQAAAESYNSMAEFSGGPNNLFNYAGGRFAPPWDHGPELVALITSTIDPAFWRQNGGNGSLHYYQPLRVLVLGATTQVHKETYELLWKLREAGR